ncbi:MAG: ABC transporter permease subunit [Planctomycetota bacterium]
MSREKSAGSGKIAATGCLVLWGAVIFLPLLFLFIQVLHPAAEGERGGSILPSLFRSFCLASGIAGAAVVLGYVPGRLLGTCRGHKDLLSLLLLMPLVLPRYVLYYAWTLLLSPTTELGRFLGARPELARFVGTSSSCLVLVMWYWPLAALLIAQGWRNMDREVWDCASLDAGPFRVFRSVTLPLLARPLGLAFAVCLVLSLSEFTTFHLAGIQTVGTELAVLYQMSGSVGYVGRAAWPVVVPAVILAVVLGRNSRGWQLSEAPLDTVKVASQRWRWGVLLVLIVISLGAPVSLLVGNVSDGGALGQFWSLHVDELGWSLVTAVGGAGIAHLIAFGALSLERTGVSSRFADARNVFSPFRRVLSFVVRSTIFLAMFVPASLVAVSLLQMLAVCNLPSAIRQGWYIVSAGQAARFTGVAVILFLLMRYSYQRQLSEMASLDGASRLRTWWHVHLPRCWPLVVGSFILLVMLGMTELSGTMVLLPAGLPNFAQSLLNQMHYARDQHVIASCLMLTCLFLVLAGVLVLLLRLQRLRREVVMLMLAGFVLGSAGCDDRSGRYGQDSNRLSARILYTFGRTGWGRSEFVYPRAVDLAAEGFVFVADKTGRIQRLTTEGDFQLVIKMPLIEAGKPTGISIGPEGNLYVADTHYHRIVVFSPDGELVKEFGRFGEDGGAFIYPTDVAFAPDGRVFVSEYGGNDRISVFDGNGIFLYCFGSCGSGENELARPSALCVDKSRGRLYVADACNHRIAIYDLKGNLQGYIGTAGRGAGQLRYPYDLALLTDGTVVVCEFGNNRLQLFSPAGESIAVYGCAGRELGELAYPWGVAVDDQRRAFVVDAGNNRIQVWQL